MTEQLDDNRMRAISEGEAFEIYASLDAERYPDVLPNSLAPEEISSLGLTIANAAERINPSRSGVRNGNRAERHAIEGMAILARNHGDIETSKNALEYLSTLGVRGKLSAAVINFSFKSVS